MPKNQNKRMAFAREYVIDYNSTAAAIRAGYSPRSASNQGKLLLQAPAVKAEIERLNAEQSARTGVSKERIIKELAKIAFVDHQDILEEDGRLKTTMSKSDSACVKKVKTRRLPDGSIEQEVELYDKTKALDLLGRMTGSMDGHKANQVKLDGAEVRGLVILPAVEGQDEPIEEVTDDDSTGPDV